MPKVLARHAMGDRLRFAARMNLIEAEAPGDLSSTGYALASPVEEYLVLDTSDQRGSFTVTLEPGAYTAAWFSIDGRETIEGSRRPWRVTGARPLARRRGRPAPPSST